MKRARNANRIRPSPSASFTTRRAQEITHHGPGLFERDDPQLGIHAGVRGVSNDGQRRGEFRNAARLHVPVVVIHVAITSAFSSRRTHH